MLDADYLSDGVGATTCTQRLRTIALDSNVKVPKYLLDLTASEFKLLTQADSLMAKMVKAQNVFKYLLLPH